MYRHYDREALSDYTHLCSSHSGFLGKLGNNQLQSINWEMGEVGWCNGICISIKYPYIYTHPMESNIGNSQPRSQGLSLPVPQRLGNSKEWRSQEQLFLKYEAKLEFMEGWGGRFKLKSLPWGRYGHKHN